MSPRDLYGKNQESADKLTADLLKISRAHAVLLRNVNDGMDGAPSIVLTDPCKVLGDQWSKLLDFWWALDQFTPADWRNVAAARDAARAAARAAAGSAAWDAAWDAAWAAAWDAAGDAAWDAAWDAAGDAAGDAARAAARAAAGSAAWDAAGDAAWAAAWDAARAAAWDAARASNEIQGASLMAQRGQPFFFLPMFGLADLDAIPARPATYAAA
ncbi:hypothetical protein [Sphingobium olei]|uniref:hypothetical protein n=1 Tax=Sphingobium olei TaxID=420955 RepID=UPI003D1EF671